MKIGVLTLPLHTNYGGILQAFALCEVLRRQGHEVLLVDRKPEFYDSFGDKIHIFIKNSIRVLKGESRKHYPCSREYEERMKNFSRFIDTYIPHTESIDSSIALADEFGKHDAVIVGSDQVWRPGYCPSVYDYFAKGCPENVRKIAYAASFGVDEWEFSPGQTEVCGKLLKRFAAVSVREKSAVALCEKHFGVPAEYMPDPTLLLAAEDYAAICAGQKVKGGIFAYILDESKKTHDFAEHLAGMSGKKLHYQDKVSDCAAPVEEWLQNIGTADFVLTDSFHACVFSLIFNKPFVCLGNEGRGQSRFFSLLAEFGLEDRLLSVDDDLNGGLLYSAIDWQAVNAKITALRERAFDFLNTALK